MFIVPDDEFHQNTDLLYENKIRRELDWIDKFRKAILKLHPEAIVQFKLDLHQSDIFFRDHYHVSTFCNREILDQNFYYEAIVNWARFNNFPVILMTAFDIYTKFSSSWLSSLSSVEYVSSESSPVPSASMAIYPFFVMRNYPKDNWKVDPCIEWMTSLPEITSNYFHNSHIGAIFHAEELQVRRKLSMEEYETLFLFVFHTFSFAEIVIGSDLPEIKLAITSENLLDVKEN